MKSVKNPYAEDFFTRNFNVHFPEKESDEVGGSLPVNPIK